MTGVVAKLDEFGTPAWLILMVLGFLIWWPLGLGLLGYLLWTGRITGPGRGDLNHWKSELRQWKSSMSRQWQSSGMATGAGLGHGGSSGNRAFDEYREETLRRLEAEQDEFHAYLKRLRQAKDRSEFDSFVADRRGPATEAIADPQQSPAN